MDFNEVFIEGRLTDDAVMQTMPNGVQYATFTLACNEDKRTEGGWAKRCQFVQVAVYGNYAVALMPALKKSQRAIVLGKIETSGGRFTINALKIRICEGSRGKETNDESASAGTGYGAHNPG